MKHPMPSLPFLPHASHAGQRPNRAATTLSSPGNTGVTHGVPVRGIICATATRLGTSTGTATTPWKRPGCWAEASRRAATVVPTTCSVTRTRARAGYFTVCLARRTPTSSRRVRASPSCTSWTRPPGPTPPASLSSREYCGPPPLRCALFSRFGSPATRCVVNEWLGLGAGAPARQHGGRRRQGRPGGRRIGNGRA